MNRIKVALVASAIIMTFAAVVLYPAWLFFSDCTAKVEGFGDAAGFLWQGWTIIVAVVAVMCILLLIEIITKVKRL